MRLRVLASLAAIAAIASAGLAQGAVAPALFTLAGGETQGFGGEGQPAGLASLNGPAGLAVAPDGSVFVADTINQRVRRIDLDGRIRTIAGNGKRGFGGDGGPAISATFQDPTALAIAADGSVYVADTGNSRLRVIRPDGTIATVAGIADQGFSGDGGPAAAAQVDSPGGVAVAADGRVYFSDTGNNRVRVIATDGTISTFAGNGAAGFAGDRGAATDAKLHDPAGLDVASDGRVLIADTGNNRVRAVTPDGAIATVAGTGAAGSRGDGGTATSAQLNRPLDVSAVPAGGFLVAETDGNRIRRVDRTGGMTLLAGTGTAGFAGDGGLPEKAVLNGPRAVKVLPGSVEVVVADSDNNRIRYLGTPGSSRFLSIATPKASVRAPLRKIAIKFKKGTLRGLLVGDVRIPYVVTKAGKLSAVISRKRPARRVVTLEGKARAGRNTLKLTPQLRFGRHRLHKFHYNVELTVTAGTQKATTTLELVVK